MSNRNLEVEVQALRLIVDRILPAIAPATLDAWVAAEAENVAHREDGGDTIPPTGHVDLEASREALQILTDARNRQIEHARPEEEPATDA